MPSSESPRKRYKKYEAGILILAYAYQNDCFQKVLPLAAEKYLGFSESPVAHNLLFYFFLRKYVHLLLQFFNISLRWKLNIGIRVEPLATRQLIELFPHSFCRNNNIKSKCVLCGKFLNIPVTDSAMESLRRRVLPMGSLRPKYFLAVFSEIHHCIRIF